MSKPEDVDSYIADFPHDVQQRLQRVRNMILKIAPDAVESISYGMPGCKLAGKPLIYFAGYAKHIGLYATPTGHESFRDELAAYKQGKGSVQFPLNDPMPYELIERIIRFRVQEVLGAEGA